MQSTRPTANLKMSATECHSSAQNEPGTADSTVEGTSAGAALPGVLPAAAVPHCGGNDVLAQCPLPAAASCPLDPLAAVAGVAVILAAGKACKMAEALLGQAPAGSEGPGLILGITDLPSKAV